MRISRKCCRAWKRGKPEYMRMANRKQKSSTTTWGNTFSMFTNRISKNVVEVGRAAIAAGVALSVLTTMNPVYAMPSGGSVTAGQGKVTQSGSTMTVQQDTGKLAINWQDFNIGQGEKVQFIQPNAQSVALNRVIGNNASGIYGQLSANGKVFLINPNGILFSKTAQVNVGGIVASSLQLRDSDFMNGNYVFSKKDTAGSVINQGTIQASDGGYVALLANHVGNEGLIFANKGSIALGAGDKATLDFTGDGLINLTVNQEAINAQAANSNLLQANGGLVVMTARAAGDLTGSVINNSGVIKAQSLGERNGKIVLDGGSAGQVNVSGTLDASGAAAGQNGGTVKVLGNHIQADDISINAAGDAGGGTVFIGGDNQGKGLDQNAAITTIGQNSTIKADALTSGNGGNVVVWANDITTFAGNISAKGGTVSGDGGQAEVSGKQKLAYQGFTDLRAAAGTTGTLLLDPNNYTISASGGDMTGTQLATQLQGSSVYISSDSGRTTGDGDINVTDSVSWSSNNSLTLSASRDINIQNSITNSGTYSGLSLSASRDINITNSIANSGTYSTLSLNAARDANIGGAITSGGRFSVTTSGGDINVNSAITTSSRYYDLTLSAYHDILVKNTISSTNGRDLTLRADNTGVNSGTVTFNSAHLINVTGSGSDLVKLYYNPASNYTGPHDYSSNITAGTLTSYMLVNDITHLQAMNTNLSGTYALGKNINATGATFTPVGDSSQPFRGTLDGYGGIGNYYITSLTINLPTSDNVGLFGVASGATLKNLNLMSSNITGQNSVGGLVGSMTASTLSSSSNSGSVTGQDSAGGLVGTMTATSQLSGSQNSTSVSGQNSTGGLVGTMTTNSTISSSSNNGSIRGTDYTGGLVGKSDSAKIQDSYNNSTITGTGSYTGGLAGAIVDNSILTNTTLGNSYSSNSIYNAGTVNGQNYTGGLAGQSDHSTITGVYNRGTITGSTSVGGVVGQADNGNNIQQSFNQGRVTGGNDVGGIIGTSGNSTVGDSYNSATITANLANSVNTGGLIGSAGTTTTLQNSYDLGAVVGVSSVGGLVGNNNGTITDTYSTGAVSGTSGVTGGLVGTNSGTVASSYWDKATSGQSTSAAGTGLTTADGMKQGSYSGWDFTNKWYISEDNTRPILRSEYRNYIINTHELQLMALLKPSATYYLSAVDMNDLTNAADVWNTATGFVPVGTSATPFTGTVYGSTINGLVINRPTTDNVGLFGYTSNATIQSVALTNANIVGRTNVGGIVGQQNGGTIQSSSSSGTVNGTDNTGGIVGNQINGTLSSNSNSAQITGSNSNTGGITGQTRDVNISYSSNSGIVTGKDQTGGIVGNQINGTLYGDSNSAQITGSNSNTGGLAGQTSGVNISYSNNSGIVTGKDQTGGIVGNQINGTLSSDSNSAQIMGSNSNTGGIAGQANGTTITASYNTQAVTGVNSTGGLVGSMTTGSIQNNGTSYSYNTGTVTGTGIKTGGLVGQASGTTITNVYNTAAVTGVTDTGGLAGYQSSNGSVATSYNSGAVTGTGNYTGGLAGYVDDATITNAYNNGVITGGGSYTGGVAGYLNNSANLTNTYNSALLISNAHSGGLVGDSSNSQVNNSFWDKGASGQATSSGGTGETTAVMLTKSSYPWDFNNIWGMIDGSSYPYLKWQFTSPPQIISGTVSNSSGGLSAKTVQIAEWGSLLSTATTGANGFYYLALPYTISSNTLVTSYLVNDANNKGTDVRLAPGGAITGFDITKDAVIVSGTGMTNYYLAYAKSGITDLPYSYSYNGSSDGYDLNVTSGFDFITATGSTYTPGGNVTTTNGSQTYNGTLNLANATTLQANGGSISLGTVNAGANTLLAQAQGSTSDITLTGIISTTASGDAVVLDADRNFINNQGSTALDLTGSGRWLVYSTDPTNGADNRNGLSYSFKQYGSTYGDAIQQSTGNGFIYSIVPTVNVTLTGTVSSKTYDGTLAADLVANNLVVSGTIDGDSVSASGLGAFQDKNVGSSKPVVVTNLSVSSATNGSAAVYGYAVNNPTGAVTGTITAKNITADLVGTVTKIYDGTETATLGVNNYSVVGKVNTDDLSLSGLGTYNNKTVGSNKTVNVQLTLAGNDAGNYSLQNTLLSGNIGVITAKQLTVNLQNAVTKVYDGTRTANLTGSNYTVSGIVDGDTVNLNNPISGTYDSKTAGSAKTVTVTGLGISGADGGNYQLASTSTSAAVGQIGKATVSAGLTGTVNKVYDGTRTANLTGSNYTVSGIVDGDTVNLNNPVSGTYDNKTAGSAKTVTVTGLGISGTDVDNYQLASTSTSGAVGQIGKATVSAGLTGSVNKVYDGTRTANLTGSNYTVSGIVDGDTVNLNNPISGTYDSKNVGSAKTVTVTGLGISGTDGGNYQLASTSTSGTVGQIEKATVSAGLTGSVSKIYDGNATANLTGSNYTVSGIVDGDTVNLNNPVSGTYDNKTAGSAKTVTVTGLGISGTDVDNYQLASTSTSGAVGQIGKATVSAGLTGTVNKVYDGTRTANLTGSNYTVSGIVDGDTVNLNNPVSGTYDSKNVGSAKTVTVTGLGISGADGGNYQLASTSTSAAVGQIGKATVSAGLTGSVNKVYDGTRTANLTGSNYTVSGIVDGDTVNLNNPVSGTYDNKAAGSAKTVTVTGLGISGTDVDNYQLASTSTSGAVGQIGKATVSAGLTGTVNKVYDGTRTANLTGSNYTVSGIVDGDTVNLNNPVSGTYDSKNVGSAKTVTVTGLGISGADGGNYQLASTSTSGTVGQIGKATVSAGLTGSVSKVYDGTSAANLTGSNYTVSGIVAGDTVNLNNPDRGVYDSMDAGQGKTVTVNNVALLGSDAGNYQLTATTVNGSVGVITPVNHTVITTDKSNSAQDSNPHIQVAQGGVTAPAANIAVTTPQTAIPVPSSISMTSSAGGNASSYTVDISSNSLTIKRVGASNSGGNSTEVNGNIALLSVSTTGIQTNGYYNVASGGGSLTMTAGTNATVTAPGSEPSTNTAGANFSLATASGAAEFKVIYADGTMSIQPLNDAAKAMADDTGGNKQLVAATGMVAAQEHLGVNLQSVTTIYVHE